MPPDLKSRADAALGDLYHGRPTARANIVDAFLPLILAIAAEVREAALREAHNVCQSRKFAAMAERDMWQSDKDKGSCTADALEASLCASGIRNLILMETPHV